MADLEAAAWSETAANNIQPSPDGWPPNSSPNIVYTTDREIMGAIKRDWNRRNATVTSGGSANAQTLTYTATPVGYIRGQNYGFIAGFTNTGPTTLNVNGAGAQAIVLNGASLAGGEIKAGLISEVIFDGTNFQLVGGSSYAPISGGTPIGPIAIKGVIDGSAAAAGNVGEIISSVSGTPALTSNSVANLTSISLTAGDWDVQGEITFTIGTGGATLISAGISTTSVTFPGSAVLGASRMTLQIAFGASTTQFFPLRPCQVSVASTTPVYLVVVVTFPSGITTAQGVIWARRAR